MGTIMALTGTASITSAEEFGHVRSLQGVAADNVQTYAGAVSWGAILAGAAAAAALSLILLILGTGLGLSSVSPWAHKGVNAATFGLSTIVWVTVSQLLASGMGGYLAGRLRTKWVAVHSDEVYFRDTAHGFLAWAVASLVTAALLASFIGSVIGGGVKAGASMTGAAATVAAAGAAAAGGSEISKSDGEGAGPAGYLLDSLFRRDLSANAGANAGVSAPLGSGAMVPIISEPAGNANRAEVTRIFANSLSAGPLPAQDVRYAGQLIAQRTGLTQADAEKRVTDTYARMQAKMRDAEVASRDAADKARKASVHATLWLFISLLGGAFAASWAATCGGRQRDA